MTNLYNLFKFLEDKRNKPIPLKYKLIYAPGLITKEDLNVEGNLFLRNTPISSLPDNLTVKGSLDLGNVKIASLPKNLTVKGALNLENIKISSLPDSLKVGGYLDLSNTKIFSLPNSLTVGGSLDLMGTPLAEKYSKEQIRQTIEEKGGYVRGHIYY